MRKIELTEPEAATIVRAINASIDARLKSLAGARRRVRAALDLGVTPDERDVGSVEYYEVELSRLRRVKGMLKGEEDDAE